jgi:hypothetical protein
MFTHGQVYDKEDVEAGYLEGHMMRAVSSHLAYVSFHSSQITCRLPGTSTAHPLIVHNVPF